MSADLFRSGPAGPERDLEELLARYVERLRAGETLHPQEILAKHPDVGEELLECLEEYVGSNDGPLDEPAPLGELGDYTLRRPIGRGGMGVVYEAWERSMDRSVALKVLPAGVAADEKAVARFQREARLAGKLHHEHVVRVFSTGVREGTPWYAMELVDGETLARILGRLDGAEPETETPFGPKDRQDFFIRLAAAFADVADGLQHAHSKGVIHRDIKPSNLILDQDGRLRILDFGLARLEGQESLTLSGDFVGTPLYMSPEQARRRRIPVDHRTDVYSLGATLYEAICGRPPFRGRDHADTLSQIVERDPVAPRALNPRVPRDLETIVLKCLRKDTSGRYGTAEALAQDLRRFVRADAIEARAQSRVEIWLRRARRYRRRLVSGFLLASLVATVVWIGLRQIEESRLAVEARFEEVTRRAAMVAHLGRIAGDERAGPVRPVLLFEPQDLSALSGSEVDPIAAAIEELERIEEQLPSRFEAPYHRARLLRLLGREDEARVALERSLALRPGFVPAEFIRAQIDPVATAGSKPALHGWGEHWVTAHEASLERRFEEVARSYDALQRTEMKARSELYLGSSIEFRLGHGLALLEGGDAFGAALDFAAAVERWPGFREPWLLLASACHRGGQRERAEKVFQRFYEQAASRDEAAYWIAATCRVLGDYAGALEWTDRIERAALREQVKSALLLCTYRFAEAREAAERAIVAAPDDALGHALLSVSLTYFSGMKGRDAAELLCGESLAAAQRAVALRPESAVVRAILAFSLQANGDYEAAESTLAEALELGPDEGLPWYVAGEVAFLEGRFVLAEQRLRRAVELFRAAGLANEEALALAQIAEVLRIRDLPRAAFEACRTAIAVFPENRAQSRLGALSSWWLDEDESAIELYRRALEFCPDDAIVWSRLAEVLVKLGRFDEARGAIREALRIEPELDEALSMRGRMELAAGDVEAALGLQVEAVRLRGRSSRFANRGLAAVLLRPPEPAGDPRLDPLAADVDAMFSSIGERRDPARALLLLHAQAGRDLDRAHALAKQVERRAPPRADSGDSTYAYGLATLALVEHARGEGAQAVRTLERALSDPQGAPHLEEVLESWRDELAGRLVSYATVEARGPAAFEAAAEELLGSREGAAFAKDRDARVALFVRALAHERGGRASDAEADYRTLVQLDEDPTSAAPRLGVFRTLALQGRAPEAEEYLREWLLRERIEEREAWEAWIVLCYAQLALRPAEIASRLGASRSGGEGEAKTPRYLDDLRWSLERLERAASGGPRLRILAGSEDGRSAAEGDGSPDRFFVGGEAKRGPGSTDPEAGVEEALYARVRRFGVHGLEAQRRGMGYRIPLPNGRYRVTLWLAALDCDASEGASGVSVEGRAPQRCEAIELELDPELVRACRRSTEVAVVDGLLEIECRAPARSVNVAALEIEGID